jgi:hypothetical protein
LFCPEFTCWLRASLCFSLGACNKSMNSINLTTCVVCIVLENNSTHTYLERVWLQQSEVGCTMHTQLFAENAFTFSSFCCTVRYLYCLLRYLYCLFVLKHVFIVPSLASVFFTRSRMPTRLFCMHLLFLKVIPTQHLSEHNSSYAFNLQSTLAWE